ncbi:MAG: HAD-IIIC family phosphatase [Lachnospiraceae bacterium]|nr:HAD-IIIC family phosphatase [Lachnospiraceae bacterium]
MLQKEEKRLEDIWNSLKNRYRCSIIQNNFEYYPYRVIGNGARSSAYGNVRYIERLNEYIDTYADNHKGFYVNDLNYLSSLYGLLNWYDDRMWALYKYPFSIDMIPVYAKSLADIIKSIYGMNKKLVISDLDNTLWGGIISEDGADGIRIGSDSPQGEMYEQIQRYLRYLSERGIVLAINSKNDYDEGISGIRSDRSVLEEKNFSKIAINWEKKDINVNTILNELNLLQGGALFIDDSALERDIVKNCFPSIKVFDSSSPADLLRDLETNDFFEYSGLTADDGQRGKYYRDNIERLNLEKEYADYDEFLISLDMECICEELNEKNMDRVLQLLNKTNQFNFLTHRFTEDKIRDIYKDKTYSTFVLTLNDRYGTNGIVSVAICNTRDDTFSIEDWVMSCRVFRRGLEYMMLLIMCEVCKVNGIGTIRGYYKESDRNKKIRHFFRDNGFIEGSFDSEEMVQEWVCKDIHGLEKGLRSLVHMSLTKR